MASMALAYNVATVYIAGVVRFFSGQISDIESSMNRHDLMRFDDSVAYDGRC